MAEMGTHDGGGSRELKAQASAVVRRAAAGEVITITDRGRPVARIVPLRGDEGGWDRMVEAGGRLPGARGARPRAASPPPRGALARPVRDGITLPPADTALGDEAGVLRPP